MKKKNVVLDPIPVPVSEVREQRDILLSIIDSYYDFNPTHFVRRTSLDNLKKIYSEITTCVSCSTENTVNVHPHLWERVNGIAGIPI